MNNILKIIKYSIIYIIIIVSFVLLLMVVSSFPSKWIKKNTQESSELLLQEGNRKITYVIEKLTNMEFDNYTDALMINTAYSIDNKTPLYSAFIARKNYVPGITKTIEQDEVGELKSASKYESHNEVGELRDTINDESEEAFEYARYWHGYLIFLRPLLILFNLQEIRIILTGIFVCLAIDLLLLIAKKINKKTAILFLLGLIGVEYFYMGLSMQGCFVFIISMLASIFIIEKYEKIKDISLVFFIIGILTNFLDFLTVPLLTWGMPIIIYFLMSQKNKEMSIKQEILIFIKISISWISGYFLTWLAKWMLVDIIYDRNLIKTAIGQVLYRTVGNEKIGAIDAILCNVSYMIIPIIVSLIATVIIETQKIKTSSNEKKELKIKDMISDMLPYLIIGIIPFIWYIALKNHSYYHGFFTYRNLFLSIVAIPIAIDKIMMLGERE